MSASSVFPRPSALPPPASRFPADPKSNIKNPISPHLPSPISDIRTLTPFSPFYLPTPITPRRRPAAFTLIELMVAAAITSLLLLGMTGIFDQAMKAWRLSSRRADAEREVRAAMATIERDLGGLVIGPRMPLSIGRFEPTEVGISSFNYPNLAPRSASGAWSNVSTALFFASAQRSDPASAGDISGVGYYVAWDPKSNEGRGGYNLYRYFNPPDLFFGAMSGFIAGTGALYPANNQDEIVGANILNFWAQLVNVPAGLTAGPQQLPNQAILTQRPSYIQLELTAFGSEAIRSFQTREDWGNTNNIKKFGRSYIWRVDL